MAENIFLQISVLLGITVSIALIMRLLRQPLIVAYIIAGLISGPLFLNLVDGGKSFFQTFANFGIVLLLFIVGLSLNFQYIKKLGRSVVIGEFFRFVITVALGIFLMKIMHFGLLSSIFVSIALSFSSTIIVVKLLSEKRDLETLYGRYSEGLLLLQDVIAILIMIFLNTSGLNNYTWYESILVTGSKVVLLTALVFLLAKYLLPPIMDKVARNSELMFIFTIAWCFGVASLIYWSGFSVEIGAIIAGISLGASPYQPEIASRIRPLRDFFIVLFFIVLGSELKFVDLREIFLPALVLSFFVIIVDPLILYFVMRRMKFTRRSAVLAGVTAAQVSEFGFILIFKGQEVGMLHGSELSLLTLVALITIIISSYFITYNEQIYKFLMPWLNKFGKDMAQPEVDKFSDYTVYVIGYHRIGWKICETLAEKRIKFAVIDFNPDAIKKLKHRGIPAFFGDVGDVEFLESLSLDKAKLIVMTIPEADDQKNLITFVRRKSEKPIIVANLYQNRYLEDLYEAGANYVMMPHLLGGLWISEVLKFHPWTNKTFSGLRKEQHEEMKLRFTAGTHG